MRRIGITAGARLLHMATLLLLFATFPSSLSEIGQPRETLLVAAALLRPTHSALVLPPAVHLPWVHC